MTVLRMELWPIEKPIDYPNNVKKHPQDQIDRLAKAILDQGFDVPIVVDADGVIIKGHGRRKAARQAGLAQVPVIIRDDLTPEQVKAARLTDNRTALSDIDTEMLRLELADMNADLLKGVFDSKELEFTLADLGQITDAAFVPDLDAAVEAQQAETAGKVEAMKTVRIPLKKAFGFDSVSGADEFFLSRWMANLEASTGKKGEEAFVAHIKAAVEAVSQ